DDGTRKDPRQGSAAAAGQLLDALITHVGKAGPLVRSARQGETQRFTRKRQLTRHGRGDDSHENVRYPLRRLWFISVRGLFPTSGSPSPRNPYTGFLEDRRHLAFRPLEHGRRYPSVVVNLHRDP